MSGNFNRLGEKTLNRIAEAALSSQLKRAEQFRVQVKTDPNLLARGILKSLAIAGRGVQIDSLLQIQEMEIVLDTIAVSPFKALMGNIQLTQPSQGIAYFTLCEMDIASAIDIDRLQQQLASYCLTSEGQPVKASIQALNCRFVGDRQIEIKTHFISHDLGDVRNVSLTIVPRACNSRRKIVLDDYFLGRDSDPDLSLVAVDVLLAEASRILNLQDFQVEGFSLEIKNIAISRSRLTLQADAKMSHFPL